MQNDVNLPADDLFTLASSEHNVTENINFQSLEINGDLVNFIKNVLKKNPGWKAQLERVNQAKVKVGYFTEDSKVNMVGSFGWSPGKEKTRESGFKNQKTPQWQSRGNLNWEIDIWGKWLAHKKETFQIINAENYAKEAARLLLIYETAKLWYTHSYLVEDIRLVEKQIRNYHESHVLHIHKYLAGLDDNESLIVMENEIRNLVIDYNQLKEELSICRIQLQTIIANPFDHNIPIAIPFSDEPVPQLPNVLPTRFLEGRPDILEGLARIKAQIHHTKGTALDLYPSLNLNLGSIGMSGDLSDPFEQWKFSGGPLLNIPIWNPKGKTDLKINQQQIKILELNWKETILNAVREIEVTTISHNSAIHDLKIAKNIEEENLKLLKLSESKYHSGLISKIQLLKNQNSYEQSKRMTLGFKMKCLLSFFELSKSLGINWA